MAGLHLRLGAKAQVDRTGSRVGDFKKPGTIPIVIHILYVYVCINLGMEARVLHAECQEEQLEVDPQIVAPDVTQLQEDLSPIAPLVQNMLAKERSGRVDSVRDISAGLASRHRFLPRQPSR